MAPKIHDVLSAEAGWRAYYTGELEGDAESTRVVAWALVDPDGDAPELVGFVVSPDDPTRIVLATAGVSVLAPDFERYGFRDE